MPPLPRDALVLVNPAAGAGTAGERADDVAARLRAHGMTVECITTRSADHAVELAAAADPATLLLPLGGDGMIARVAEGALTSGALVTPLPAGRGNDLVRALGVRRDTSYVLDRLPRTRERRIDVGTVNGRTFLGTAIVGYAAEASRLANAVKKHRSALVYTAAGVVTAFRSSPLRFDVKVSGPDGEVRWEVDGWNLSIGNSGRHGGGLTATPGASVDDGLLHVCFTTGRRFHQLASSAALERGGNQTRLSHVRTARGTQVSVAVNGDTESAVFADGDELTHTPAVFGVREKALRLLVP